MPIRTYLLLIVLISSLGGVGLSYIQLQRNTTRLHVEADIRRADTFVSSLRPLEDSLKGFLSNFDLYIGSGQFYMEGSISLSLELYEGFFADLERLAPNDEQKASVRSLAEDLLKFDRYMEAVKEHGNQLPNDILNEYDKNSLKQVADFEQLREQAVTHLNTMIMRSREVQEASRLVFVGSVAVFIVVAVALLRWASRSIGGPIGRLTSSAEAAVEHGGHFQSTQLGASEVVRLSAAIGHLTNSLEAAVMKRTDELNKKNRELNQEISRRAETENRLLEAKTSAEAANAAKSDFLAVMSHELRTPLNSILGFTDVLKDGIQGALNVDQLKSLNNIADSGKHLLALINDILDLSKIEAGKESLSYESIEIESICRDAVGLLSSQAAKKSVDLKLTVAPEAVWVHADRRRLRQILFNLLSNAVKFTAEGGAAGLEVELRPDKTGGKSDGYVRFSVWDEGIGISRENQKKLFQPFVQVDSRLARNYEGSGLGLSLVKRLVKMHGGRIKVKSREGKGSRFSVYLPWSSDIAGTLHDSALLEDSSIGFYKGNPNWRPMVLLVEDNRMNQESITAFMEANRFDVLVAEDGDTALRLAENQRFDLILTDIQMPGMDGLELTRRLRERAATREVPIIALTAMARDEDRDRCLAAGVDEFLTKPLDMTELVKLADHLTGRETNSTA